MKYLSQFKINFSSLKEGKHDFNFSIDNKFFKYFNNNDFNSCNISCDVVLNKKSNHLKLSFRSIGKININCHVSNEPFDYTQESALEIVIKFGPEYNDENDELIILPVGANEINISQQLYEMIILSLPIKIIHPGVEKGTLKTETLKKLKDLANPKKDKETNDPRWDKLKDLI